MIDANANAAKNCCFSTGSVGLDGTVESALNLEVARALAAELRGRGFTVVLSRQSEYRVPIITRAQLADALDVGPVISLHQNAPNASPSDKPGTEIYVQEDRPQSRRLGGLIYAEVVTALGRYEASWVAAGDAGVLSVVNTDGEDAYGIVRRPVGLSLDPGGIGKGFAADLVVTEALRSGTGGALVSIGGDIAAAGRTPTPAGWIVDIEDPHRPPAVLRRFAVSDGGIATSSTRSRRWRTGGVDRHHVIDPMTGDSSRTDLATVTVVETSGWLAEAHATAALLSGAAGAIGYLAEHGLSGVVVTTDERVLTSDDLAGIAAGVRS